MFSFDHLGIHHCQQKEKESPSDQVKTRLPSFFNPEILRPINQVSLESINSLEMPAEYDT